MKQVILAKLYILTALAFTYIAIEWMAGCGEVTYFEDHTWQTNECVFRTVEIKTGTW